MQISVETSVRLTDKQLSAFKNLFKWLLQKSTTEKSNVVIPFDGQGNYGKCKSESFHDIANGNGDVPAVVLAMEAFSQGKI